MDKGYRLSAATGIHKGDREYQQDQVALLAHPRIPGCVMGVVADGMGGRAGGRKASDQVLLTSRQLFERYAPDSEDGSTTLRQIGEEAHLVIKLTAIAAEQEPHSTIAAFIINPGGESHWMHSGDSRLYHFRGPALLRRTKDHSYVQALVDQGELRLVRIVGHAVGIAPGDMGQDEIRAAAEIGDDGIAAGRGGEQSGGHGWASTVMRLWVSLNFLTTSATRSSY